MKLRSHPHRATRVLGTEIDHNLRLYSLAAAAAGVSLLALTQPSEAEIIYTKTQQIIGTNGFYGLDLNHDGVVDFIIQESGATFFLATGSNKLGAKEAYGNGVAGITKSVNHVAYALHAGAIIGPNKNFLATSNPLGEFMAASFCDGESGCVYVGEWRSVGTGYLGLKFKISGKTHYGWARLSVEIDRGHNIVATLTGYAYETVPNEQIKAGETSDAEVATATGENALDRSTSETSGVHRSPTLARLALGVAHP
ncbi:MAG TPA: hypothetical protein VF753_10835 [Terriglobales bacterium]